MANHVIAHPSLYSATGKRGRKAPNNILRFPDVNSAYIADMDQFITEMREGVHYGDVIGVAYVALRVSRQNDSIGLAGLCKTAPERVVYQLNRLNTCLILGDI